MTDAAAQILVVMGVSGVGKTCVARAVAGRLGWDFQEGDALHPPANIAKMSAGIPLTDFDRGPWLQAVADWVDRRLAERSSGVVTCSALRRRYREIVVGGRPGVRVVYLRASEPVIAARLQARTDHFMPPGLLRSQFDTLEEPSADEPVIVVDAARPVDVVVEDVVSRV